MYWPRGRVWGGSSALNAMVYIRGHAYDYDGWETAGAKGWSYADCLPYFKKAQTHELGWNLNKCRHNLVVKILVLDCIHTMRAHFENNEKCDGSKI